MVSPANYKADVAALALLAFEMAYGLNPELKHRESLYEKERLYGESGTMELAVSFIKMRLASMQPQPGYTELNDLILRLLHWDETVRLTAASCLTHPFFAERDMGGAY